MLVFETITMLVKCSIISGSAGRTLYTHKQSEVNTKQIQIWHKDYFKLLNMQWNRHSAAFSQRSPMCHEVSLKCRNKVLGWNSICGWQYWIQTCLRNTWNTKTIRYKLCNKNWFQTLRGLQGSKIWSTH